MSTFRVIAKAEYECFVEADDEEQALEVAQKGEGWHRTMNKELTDHVVTDKLEKK